jgi:hypothetical protein
MSSSRLFAATIGAGCSRLTDGAKVLAGELSRGCLGSDGSFRDQLFSSKSRRQGEHVGERSYRLSPIGLAGVNAVFIPSACFSRMGCFVSILVRNVTGDNSLSFTEQTYRNTVRRPLFGRQAWISVHSILQVSRCVGVLPQKTLECLHLPTIDIVVVTATEEDYGGSHTDA